VKVSMSVRSFKLEGSGLSRVLGALEAEIMEAVWEQGEACVQDVCDSLGPEHNYKTVMTVMNRLVEKKVLLRRKVSKAFYYNAAAPREQFVKSMSRSVIGGLINDFGPTAIAQFVDVVGELGPDELAELDRLIHQKSKGG
jgi:predicted transcriptional regulator